MEREAQECGWNNPQGWEHRHPEKSSSKALVPHQRDIEGFSKASE